MTNSDADNNALTNNKHPDTNVGNLNFQPMPKRFMVWSKQLNDFARAEDGKAYVFDNITLIAEWLNVNHLAYNKIMLVQSTNLFDKDDKEIFEGSIVKVEDNFDEYGLAAGRSFIIDFDKGGWRLQPFSNYTEGTDKTGWRLNGKPCVELLGHILSNPELVEEKDD